MIGVHADMMPFLTWIENHGKQEIKWVDLQPCARESEVMMSLDPLQVAHEMWSWLNLTLEKSSSAQRTFRNVGELNGCEVYRRLVTPLGITKPSVTRRGVLRDKVQQPLRAKSMLSVMDAVEAWEENKLVYSKAGGTAHDDEEERAQLYKILPDNISQDMLSHAHDQPTADALIDWMREKETFLKEHGGKSGSAHLAAAAEAQPGSNDDWSEPIDQHGGWHGNEGDEPMSLLTAEQLAEMPDGEIATFIRRKGFNGKGSRKGKGKGKGYGKSGKGYGGGNGKGYGEPPPRGVADLRCSNCGGKGHAIGDCSEELVPYAQRPCHKCGKPGHISRDCNAKALLLDGGE